MRSCALLSLLLVVPVLRAGGKASYENAERIFDQAREKTSAPGGQAAVYPAVERLIATGDVRAVGKLASFLVETFAREEEAVRLMLATQKGGARAFDRMKEIDKELEQLEFKQRAGDRSVGPRMEKLRAERERMEEVFEDAKRRTQHFDRLVGFLRELRGKLADGLAGLLRRFEGAELEAGFRQLRAACDVAVREQGLYLVRILRACGKSEAEPHLLDVMAHPKAGRPVLLAAGLAVARLGTKTGCRAVLRLAEREPELKPELLYGLSVAAGRALPDLDAARTWIASLG